MAGGTDDTESCLDIFATPASDSTGQIMQYFFKKRVSIPLLFFLAVGGISDISSN